MVQRKVPSKLSIRDDHVKSDERLANLKLSSSQYQDGKGRGADRMNNMKKSSSIMLSDLETLQSPPSRRSLFQPGKPTNLHVSTIVASLQEQKPLVRRSPNYMKPTSSSDAKKEPLLVSHRNAESGSQGKNLLRKCLSDSKASSFSGKKPSKTFSRSSSLNSVRTLTKTPSFKPCKSCTRGILVDDMNAPERATCSSTLKDAKFPAYLMLNPEGSESEGASGMKVCPYKYCSLNGHPHNGNPSRTPLPPLKSFVSAKRRLLETQKNIMLEAQGHPRLMVPSCETKEDSQIEHIDFDGKPARDEADTGNPTITTLVQETGMDLFVEIYAKEKEGAGEIGRLDSLKDIEDQGGIEFVIEENGSVTEEDGVKQIIPGMTHDLPQSEIGFEDSRNYFGVAAVIEADTKGSFHQEQRAEDADENHPLNLFRKEICTGNYCNEVSYDVEHLEDIELDYSDLQNTDMEWEEETDSKFESLSESSHDISEIWIDDTLSSHYADILVDEAFQEAKGEKSIDFETQPRGTHSVLEGTSESIKLGSQETDYLSNSISYEYDQSSLTKEVLQHLGNAEDNNRENEKHAEHEETVENSEGHKTSDTCQIDDESRKDSKTGLEKNAGISQQNQIHPCDAPEEITTIVQDQEILEEDQVKATKLAKNWQWATSHKRPMQDADEMGKIKPRKPNFLPLVPDPESEKVDLKHQMIDERKNAEEWMLDFALRQTVTKLAPAGKRKVALLVEAFETVMSVPKCETHMRNNSAFSHTRPIQACS